MRTNRLNKKSGTLRHLFINPREGVYGNIGYLNDFDWSEEKLNYQNYIEESSVDLETKRERTLHYLFYYEAFKVAAQKVGYEIEVDPELKMIENPLDYNK